MADTAAAPAAPSQSAPPAAQPLPGAPHTTITDSPVRDAAPPDSTVRLAKPIRPIPRLPGVHPDAIDDDSPFPAPPSPADRAATPPRGPDGRFVAPSSATPPPDEGMHTPEPGQADDPAAPFEFAGERFPTRAAAEQNFKSMRGQFKPLQALARSVGGVEHVVPQFARAAESARGWKAEADRLRAELANRNGGAQPATPAAQPSQAQPAEAATEAADVDWELYAEVKKLATESGEPWKAEQWLIEQVRAADRAHLQKLLDERDAPLKAQQAKEAVAAQTENLFGNLAGYTNADGSPAFPELFDPEAAYSVGQIWASLGLPREAALTPQGAIAAIATYRMTRPQGSQARPAPQPTPPQPLPPAPPTDAHAAAALVDGRPTVASVGGNGSPSAEAARILAGLRSVSSPNRNVLGFDA